MQVLGGWALPLPTIDPQIVRRSAAALDRYGPDFRYGHFLQLKKLGTVLQMTGGVAAIAAAAQFKPTRARSVQTRGSGDGQSVAQRPTSWFKVTFLAEGVSQSVSYEVSGCESGR